jgi:hypothetical protein
METVHLFGFRSTAGRPECCMIVVACHEYSIEYDSCIYLIRFRNAKPVDIDAKASKKVDIAQQKPD